MILDGDKVVDWIDGYIQRLQAQPSSDAYRGAIRGLQQARAALPQFAVDLDGPSPHNVRHTDPEGAQEAAGSNTFGRSKNRIKVYQALKELRSGTPEEIAAKAIELFPGVYPPYSLARRVTDLAERGLIEKTGERRATTAGGTADVWALIDGS